MSVAEDYGCKARMDVGVDGNEWREESDSGG